MSTPIPYRPSNGTEGMDFLIDFCCQCARSDHLKPTDHDPAPAGCEILDLTYRHDVDDPEYPREWLQDDTRVWCTAFVPEGQPLAPPRCAKTVDMFDSEDAA